MATNGVPIIFPVFGSNVRPLGKGGFDETVYGGLPAFVIIATIGVAAIDVPAVNV